MNRDLDVLIAKAKGLDVVGEAEGHWCNGSWYIEKPWSEGRTEKCNKHPVYVRLCNCNLDDDEPGRIQQEIADGWIIELFGHYDFCLDVVPFWSSDLETAWELVNEMVKTGVDVFVAHDLGQWYMGYWHNGKMCYVEGDTSQEAICQAYLEWCDLTRNKK